MLHFHNQRYELLAWCVMPNHVHVLVHVWQTPLWKMMQSWKIRVENQRRKLLLTERRAPSRPVPNSESNPPRRCSALRWQREYWDTFMSDEAQEKTAVRYIENNPVKAKLFRTPEDWPFISARFRDEYARLVILPGTPVSDPACCRCTEPCWKPAIRSRLRAQLCAPNCSRGSFSSSAFKFVQPASFMSLKAFR